jgi:hypothetical protein
MGQLCVTAGGTAEIFRPPPSARRRAILAPTVALPIRPRRPEAPRVRSPRKLSERVISHLGVCQLPNIGDRDKSMSPLGTLYFFGRKLSWGDVLRRGGKGMDAERDIVLV